jgi:hypothetical protein
MIERLKTVPPAAWLLAVAALGLVVLTWHRYAQDDNDTDWTSPKEAQPPAVVAFKPQAPAGHGHGRPMGVDVGFRSRAYPGSLIEADFSIVGEA